MTFVRLRPRAKSAGAIAVTALLVSGLAVVPTLFSAPPATAAAVVNAGNEAELKAAFVASAGTSTEVALTASFVAKGLTVPDTGTVKLLLNGHALTANGVSGSAGVTVPQGASLTVAGPSGSLTATAGLAAAGIGGSAARAGGTIVIESGTVTAVGNSGGAGIGGSLHAAVGTIEISGGTVTAKGGTLSGSAPGGAGIGAGLAPTVPDPRQNGGSITISGGTVEARGGGNSAGIGGPGGATGATPMVVEISGGTVEAFGGYDGVSIGGGRYSEGADVRIGAGASVRLRQYENDGKLYGSGVALGSGIGVGTPSFGRFSNAGNVTIAGKGHTLTIPVGEVVTNSGTLLGGGTLINHGLLVNSGTVSPNVDTGKGETVNDGVIVSTGSFSRAATTIPVRAELPSLRFDPNDGSAPPAGVTILAADLAAAIAAADTAAAAGETEAQTVLADRVIAPTRSGYAFSGWMTTAAGSIPWVDTTPITGNSVVYARWTPNPHAVTFDSQGGSQVDGVTVDFDARVPQPTNPTRAGHTFTGWATPAPGGTLWDFGADRVSGDVTLFAQWSLDSYTVMFDSQGGTDVADVTADYGSTLTRPADPSLHEHTLTGWSTTADGGPLWNFGSDAVTGATVLYAQWALNQYSVTFDSQGGTGVAEALVDYDTVAEEPAPPTRAGHTFKGWATTTTGGTPWSFATDRVTAATTLYAQWTLNTYTVTFDSRGGSEVADVSAEHGQMIAQPATPSRVGYTFAGWATVSGGKQWDFAADAVTGPTTLFAEWTAKVVPPVDPPVVPPVDPPVPTVPGDPDTSTGTKVPTDAGNTLARTGGALSGAPWLALGLVLAGLIGVGAAMRFTRTRRG